MLNNSSRSGSSENRSKHWILLSIVCILLAGFAASAGRLLVVNNPQPSDVIVVLAGETDHRPARGVELLSQGYGHRLLLNVPAQSTNFGFSEVQLAEKYIQALPQPLAVRVCLIAGLSTKDEARDAGKCLAQEQGNRVLIVTSDYHTRRALSTFRREVRGKSFSVAAAYDPTTFGTRWWTRRQWAKTFVDEALRLLWWTTVDRWL